MKRISEAAGTAIVKWPGLPMLSLFCGIGAIAIATFGQDPSPLLAPVQNVLVTLFGLGVTAFFFKALGG
ncbi:hypothetical protein [Mesorhizobium sp. ORS 3428]|uniref:hypothetical protein n=1 Tax=Mesorhizobium sp. ORS 3428 TaxID=540997 RepID=UPI0008D95286|nr:hypothetical protein [Mesorhizobium sp. ORS 3428]OHV82545.1 hypothetical protein ORS3428_27310 [Mesorhizobium sp. ORS 3428]